MTHEHLMQGLTVQHLRFTVEPIESILFTGEPGSALRGALYQALSTNFCSEPDMPVTLDHVARCPTCWLLAAEDAKDTRGQNIPRPLAIEPPLDYRFHRDSQLTFGMTLIGQAQYMLPFLARAVQKMGQTGIGRGRGRFKLIQIAEINPFTNTQRSLLNGNQVAQPIWTVTAEQIATIVNHMTWDQVTLELLTPLRLTSDNRLVHRLTPSVFMKRLLERCQRLAQHYAQSSSVAPTDTDWYENYQLLSTTAEEVVTTADYTTWQEAWSGSQRQQRYTPISGIIGSVSWQGNLKPLAPWLLWGQSLHVGKNAIKGNGWYRVNL